MMHWLFGADASWFSVPAILGTLYFLVQLVFDGIGGDADVDLADAGDTPAAEFRILSLQTISAFAMGSGWIGLAAYRFMDLGLTASAVIAVFAGIGVAWVLVSLLRALMRLQSSGNIPLNAALGQTGTVYVQIPPAGEGSGRVTLVIGNRQREFNAVQRGVTPIASHTRVGVADIDKASNTVTVEVV